MHAITFHGKETVRYESMPDPGIIDSRDVIVKVKACAICGSDLHVYHEHEKGIDLGTAMGHEFVGEVVETGSSVRMLKQGDDVMTPFTTSCGHCYYCTIGLTCRCVHNQLYGWVENGNGLQGGQAEYVRVPLADSTLMVIPEGISPEEGLLLGDILSTGYYCALQAEARAKGIYAVIGCGPVGLMTVIGARELGAERIFAIDTVPERLQRARQFGAEIIDARHDNALEILRAASEGRGADGVMEAVGSHSAVKLAVDLVRPGGIVSSVGVCNDVHLAFSPVEAYNKNLTYRIGRCPARFIMEKLIPMVRQKKYDITSIYSHRLSLADGVAGYDLFARKKDNCVKVLLQPA